MSESMEIKFRAWFPDTKEMMVFSIDDCLEDEGYYGLPMNRIIMQYTGLKDKNGKEMCGGDIVYVAGTGNCVVKQNHWGEWCAVFLDVPMFGDVYTPIHDIVMEGDLGKIQGTIHEKPELLGSR